MTNELSNLARLKADKKMQSFAFVDLETTGGSATKDRITEIGLVLVDASGVKEWSQLVCPQMRIPTFIEQMTGITNDMVADELPFAELAETVLRLLQGRLFIAHNARFDYGFLKNEFKRVGITFQPSILCTVKLSRALFPQFARHNLDSLIERHDLRVTERHRALGDAQLIYQFWQQLAGQFSEDTLSNTVKQLIGHSSLPSQIDPALVQALPESPGVYLFYGENDLPLYIGKSVNIRQRVLSHFAADHRHNKEMNLSQQLRRIDWVETAGELGALLTEAKLVKERLPVYNQRLRRKHALCAWRLQQEGENLTPELVWANDLEFGHQANLYGLYHNQRDAQKALRQLAAQAQLCLTKLGLEKTAQGKPCFAYQLKKCKGACVGAEPLLSHNSRLLTALQKLKLASWPYSSAIGIRESEELHVIDHWCYLGTAKSTAELPDILAEGRPTFDRDTYLMLKKALPKAEVIELAGDGRVK